MSTTLSEICRQLDDDADMGAERVLRALQLILAHGGHDAAHHKAWVIDQVTRLLAGSAYDALVAEAKDGEDGPETYAWDTGIAP